MKNVILVSNKGVLNNSSKIIGVNLQKDTIMNQFHILGLFNLFFF